MKLSEREIKKIAVFRALQLGDMLCSIPAIRALRKAYPAASITLLGLPWAGSLAERFPDYFNFYEQFPGYPGLPEQIMDPASFTYFLQKVQEEKYDLVLQMQGSGSISNPLVKLFASRYTAGFFKENNYCPDGNLFIKYPEGHHEIKRHLKLMAHLGIAPQGTFLEFPLTKRDGEEFQKLGLNLKPGSYVCVHPGSRGPWRQWPPRFFASLADHCADQGFKIVITGTREELDIARQVEQEMKNRPITAAGTTSIGAAGILVRDAFALISNCTGISHVAAAFETPSVVVSMDGEPERWSPVNRNLHRTIDWTKTPDYDLVFDELKLLIAAQSEAATARARAAKRLPA